MPMTHTEDADAIRVQLARISSSAVFARAGRMYPLLEYLIDAELAGDGDALNQYRIAIDVFARDERFDPTTDSIVRVEIGRLRNKLREYYSSDGSEDPIRFEVPKGRYRPKITIAAKPERLPAVDDRPGSDPAPVQAPASSHRRRVAYAIVGCAMIVVVAVGMASLAPPGAFSELALRRADDVPAANPSVAPDAVAAPTESTPPSPEVHPLLVVLPTLPAGERFALLDRALEEQPDLAEAHAAKAFLYSQALINTAFGPASEIPLPEIASIVRRHADRALELKPDLAEALVARGNLFFFTWRWAEAREAFARAEAVVPNAVELVHFAYMHAFTGRHEEALRLIERLAAANPEVPVLFSVRGLLQAITGDRDAAVASLTGTSAIPYNEGQLRSMVIERGWLAAVEIARGNHEAAIRQLEWIEQVELNSGELQLPLLAYGYRRVGREDDARRLFNEIERLSEAGTRFGSGAWAQAHLAVGEHDKALEWLKIAADKVAVHEPDEAFFPLMHLRANLMGDPVLETAPFVEVLRRITGE